MPAPGAAAHQPQHQGHQHIQRHLQGHGPQGAVDHPRIGHVREYPGQPIGDIEADGAQVLPRGRIAEVFPRRQHRQDGPRHQRHPQGEHDQRRPDAESALHRVAQHMGVRVPALGDQIATQQEDGPHPHDLDAVAQKNIQRSGGNEGHVPDHHAQGGHKTDQVKVIVPGGRGWTAGHAFTPVPMV